MGNYHVPFWRAVEEATPSLTLIILRKVAGNLGIDLSRLGRRCLATVGRIRLWDCSKSKSNTCPKESQSLLSLRAVNITINAFNQRFHESFKSAIYNWFKHLYTKV